MSRFISVSLSCISKKYKLYNNHNDRLKEIFFQKKYHKEHDALKNISFDLYRGEVVGIVGRNGSGKSTLLKIITQVLQPSSGTITLKGKVSAILELGAGFNPELSGRENIYLNATLANYEKKNIDADMQQIIAFAELDEYIDQPVKTYSSGMKSRLAFAFAIHAKPEILILDEVLSVGDVAFARKCYAKIDSLCKDSNITVLFVSHSESAILRLCNRAILLHKGEKLLDGKPRDVINAYNKMGKSEADTQDLLANKPKQNTQLFDSSLVSKSELSTQINGAKIATIAIKDRYNNSVNMLEPMGEYAIEVVYELERECESIMVALTIKTHEGLKISGANQIIQTHTLHGKKFAASWRFKNVFNCGHYFINCGILDMSMGLRELMHRKYDAFVFKVIEQDKKSTALVNIGFECTIDG